MKTGTEVSTDIDYLRESALQIELKPGMAWVLYSDNGPGGPCGQGMRTTCPHTYLMTWPNEDAMREAMKDNKWRNKKHTVMCGVVGEYTSGGLFRIIQHT